MKTDRTFDRLLAKSAKSGITLVQHTQDVLDAFRALFGESTQPSRLSECWFRFFRLQPEDHEKFFRSTLAAAAFHDIGKANDGFQRTVRRMGSQNIRHEHLSGLLLCLENMTEWLSELQSVDWDIVLSVVISHHLKVKEDSFACWPPDNTRVRIQSDDPDFEKLMSAIARELELSGDYPKIGNPVWDWKASPNRFQLEKYREQVIDQRLRPFRKALRCNERRQRLLRAVRAALIVSDAVGSARYRLGAMQEWVADVFNPKELCTQSLISQGIIDRRVKEICRAGREFRWNEFQDASAMLPDRALLLAPCGSGKTLAAWRWIAERCRERPVKRVLFLYPTRATATEGFRDYVSWAPGSDAALMHGSASYDLQGMFSNVEFGDERVESSYEVDRRLFALGAWTRRIFSATVDQFLGFLQYSYGGVCQLPLLADSVIVIDEVHSFDSAMFSALQEFLRNFDVPVLCMTATLPEARRKELELRSGLQVYNDRPGELKTIAEAPRYRVSRVEEASVRDQVRTALGEGKRVLWVVNRVAAAQELTREFALDLDGSELEVKSGIPLLCYHSRFRLQDRKKRHQRVVAAFQGERKAALAIATQVCEMSLDLDADLVVTERAPITSLIQRMGRCNRVARPRSESGDILVYSTDSTKPYDDGSLAGVDQFLDEIASHESVSQSELEAALGKAPAAMELPRDCQFLSSGPYAQSASFRDIEQFTVPAVLSADTGEFVERLNKKWPTDGLVVPVPRRFQYSTEMEKPKRFPDWLSVVSSVYYHPALGFCGEQVQTPGAIIV